jgi:hypothetical protein
MSATALPVISFPACVAHHYVGSVRDNPHECLFVCPVGHSFRCPLRTATASAERYGRNWVFMQCLSCLPVAFMLKDPNSADFVERLTALAIVRPNTTPRPLYSPPPADTTGP